MTTGIRIGADSSATRLAVIEEATWATTPTTPAFQNLRFTGETLAPAKETVQSNEIRPDRGISNSVQVGRSVAGDVNFELSYGSFDAPFLTSALQGTWSGSPADTLKRANAGTSMTLERTLDLGGGTLEYHRFLGCMVNTFTLNVTAKQIVTGTFGVMGRFGGRGASIISGATYSDANTNEPMNAASNFASLTVAGMSPAPRIRSLTLSATNNLRMQDEVGNLDTGGIGSGQFQLTGTMEAYFDSSSLYQAYLDHDDLTLSFVLGTTAGSRYRITVPTLTLDGNPGGNAGANNQDVMLTLGWTANIDRLTSPVLGTDLMIERGV